MNENCPQEVKKEKEKQKSGRSEIGLD